MNLIATKSFKYPQNARGRVLKIGERFAAEQRYAKVLIVTGLAVAAGAGDENTTDKRRYNRRDMQAEE